VCSERHADLQSTLNAPAASSERALALRSWRQMLASQVVCAPLSVHAPPPVHSAYGMRCGVVQVLAQLTAYENWAFAKQRPHRLSLNA